QHRRVVEDVNRRNFKVVGQVRARSAKRRTASGRSRLVTLPAEPAQVQVVLVVKLMIDFHHSVITVAEFRGGAQEVARVRREAANDILRPQTARSQQAAGTTGCRSSRARK